MNAATTQTSGGSRLARPGIGSQIMILGSALALADSLFNYFFPDNGIHGTWGALGVLGGSFLILLAALWLTFGLRQRRGWRWGLALLVFAALLGNGFCAWLLEARVLEAMMALTLLGWLSWLATGFRPSPGPRREVR